MTLLPVRVDDLIHARTVLAPCSHRRVGPDRGGSLPIRVGLYPDRVEVTSYPGPVPGVEAEHLLPGAHPPQVPARNPLIGEMLRALRLAENTGIPKLHRAMNENGSPAARFDFDAGRIYFRVTLPARGQDRHDR